MLNSFLGNDNYENDLFEENVQASEVYLLNDMTINRKKRHKKKCKYLCFIVLIILVLAILALKIICFIYLNYIVLEIENLNTNQVNITRTLNYVDKFETIIDFLCNNYVKC